MKTRVLTALALAPVVLGALFIANPWPLAVLAAMAAYIGGREISRMLSHDSHAAGALSAVLVVCGSFAPRTDYLPWVLSGLFLLGVLSAWTAARTKRSLLIPFSVFWAVAPLVAILTLHVGSDAWEPDWKTPVLLAILPLWGGDTAAIFAGKAFGKHLLAPTISPKKTVEGAIANLVACVLVAWGLGVLIGIATLPALLCGLAAGVLGQAGDLFESYVKRKADLKDSGNLLPGHGGLMDRIDSILFTAPAVALILAFLGNSANP